MNNANLYALTDTGAVVWFEVQRRIVQLENVNAKLIQVVENQHRQILELQKPVLTQKAIR